MISTTDNRPYKNVIFGNFYSPAYDDREFVDETMGLIRELGFNSVMFDTKAWEDFRERYETGALSQYVEMQEYMGKSALEHGLSYNFLLLYMNGDNLYPHIRYSPPIYGEETVYADGRPGKWYKYWSAKARNSMKEHVERIMERYGEGCERCLVTREGITEEVIPVCSMWDPVVAPSMWKVVLLNQFHDILPGSSIREVYEVTKEEYGRLAGQLADMSKERRRTVAGEGDAVTVFNTTGRMRDDVVNLGAFAGEALADETGAVYPVQKTEDGSIAFAKNLPSKGYKSFRTAQAAEKEAPFALHGNYDLETPFYRVRLDGAGMFTSIYDKENDREVVQEGRRANLLRMYEDKPIYFDNWDIDIYYTEKFWDVDNVEHMEWTEVGEVRAVLEITRKASKSTIRQKVIFYADSRRIEFATYVDWKEHQTLLKVHFPVAVHTDEATFDVQFGSLTRKTHRNTSWDVARFESCGQKWMDLSEGHYGVSLLNDCKYGHSVQDSDMALTLVKSGIEPNPTTDQEEHEFTYAIYPHAEGWRAAGTVDEAYKLNQPLVAELETENRGAYSFASVDRPNVVLETVKRAEDGDGIVVRMYESENALTKAKLTVNADFEKAYICNLLEETEGEAAVNGNVIDVVLKPYEVVTVLLR
jgi:alpha-mannosidase